MRDTVLRFGLYISIHILMAKFVLIKIWFFSYRIISFLLKNLRFAMVNKNGRPQLFIESIAYDAIVEFVKETTAVVTKSIIK